MAVVLLSMRRPVTMPVWLGSVSVCSTSARALSVEAPWRMRRCSVGVPSRPSLLIAVGFSPSREITTTWCSGRPARSVVVLTVLISVGRLGGRAGARAGSGDGSGATTAVVASKVVRM